ncbi:uncharacterized protein TNCV_2766381 [Trichonephila clavipes]|nr:uncharacterized protein TNCV_2766381 [Trichonephila clavipes]
MSDLQTKSFLLAKTFFNSPVTVSPHKTLNSCRGVISEPDLLSTPDAEILEGFSDQGVIQSHPSDLKLCQKWKLEKQIQEIKTNKNISHFEARRLIVPQLTQTYALAARLSTISTASQTDPNLSNIICPPLQCLTPISSKNPLPGTSSSVSTFSTSSSSTQDNLLPSPSGILPTIQTEAQQIVKRKSRNRRKHPKIQKPDIEIKRVPLRSRNATPTEITTDDEDMITYDVEEGELEQNPPNNLTIDEDPFILPKGYLRALTPSRYRNYRE